MRSLPEHPSPQDERLQYRGCRNCVWSHDGQCRAGPPGPSGWPTVEPTDWCGRWQWFREPRQTLAPAEKIQEQEAAQF